MVRQRGRHAARKNRTGPTILAVAVVLLAVAAGWSLTKVPPSLQDGPGAGTEDSASATPSPSMTTTASVEAALVRCQADLAPVERAVVAASRGADHWGDRVQARTNKLRGRITEAKKQAIYQRTRAQGRADLARFATAARAVSSTASTASCAELRRVASSSADERLPVCLTRARAATSALAAARSIMGQWQAHLRQLEALRQGDLGKARQLRLWTRASRAAPRSISVYTARVTVLAQAPPCQV